MRFSGGGGGQNSNRFSGDEPPPAATGRPSLRHATNALFAVGAASSHSAGGVRTNTTLSWSYDDGASFPGRLQLDATGGYATIQVTTHAEYSTTAHSSVPTETTTAISGSGSGGGLLAVLYEAPSLTSQFCWAPCAKIVNASNNNGSSSNCCTMEHYYQPPSCPTPGHCTWLLDCNCNPVDCAVRLAIVDPYKLLLPPAAVTAAAAVPGI